MSAFDPKRTLAPRRPNLDRAHFFAAATLSTLAYHLCDGSVREFDLDSFARAARSGLASRPLPKPKACSQQPKPDCKVTRCRSGAQTIDRWTGLDLGDLLVIFRPIEVRSSHALRRKPSGPASLRDRSLYGCNFGSYPP